MYMRIASRRLNIRIGTIELLSDRKVMSSMVNFPRLMRSVFVATSLAAALSMSQASAHESDVVAGEPVTADVAAVVVADSALTTTAAASPSEASRPVSSKPATGAGLSQAMASTAYPVAKRARVATTRPYRHVASGGPYSGSSESWYGRHFVLMVGVAY
jgi:hypothetical protein